MTLEELTPIGKLREDRSNTTMPSGLKLLRPAGKCGGHIYYHASCYCGQKTIIQPGDAKRGVGCGCRHPRQKFLTPLDSLASALLANAKSSAKGKKKTFKIELVLDEVKFLIQRPDWYIGSPPSNQCNRKHSKARGLLYSGLDRVDNVRGYSLDNVVAASFKMNDIKSDRSMDEAAALSPLFADGFRRFKQYRALADSGVFWQDAYLRFEKRTPFGVTFYEVKSAPNEV